MKVLKIFIFCVILLLLAISKPLFAQTDSLPILDSATIRAEEKKLPKPEDREFVPKKAALYSAVIPGLGQVYNRKYWKVPLFYGAAGVFILFSVQNNQDYLAFRESYLAKTETNFSRIDPFPSFSAEAVRVNRNTARRNRDFMIILASLIYALQIVDASVDAHLKPFDVSEELSWKLEPHFEPLNAGQGLWGVSLKIYLR